MKWREGDQITYTGHYESISLAEACQSLGGTWNLPFFRCEDGVDPSTGSASTYELEDLTLLCEHAGQELGRTRLKFRGVYPHGHKCEYVLPEGDEPNFTMFSKYTNDYIVTYSCRWILSTIFGQTRWIRSCGFFPTAHANDPEVFNSFVSSSDHGSPYFRKIEMLEDGQSEQHVMVVGMSPWDVLFGASEPTQPIRLYKQGKTSSSQVFIDSDEDGLSDTLEGLIGTDVNDDDTDNDGILDGLEVMGTADLPLHVLGASPLARDLVVEWDRYSARTRAQGMGRVDVIDLNQSKMMEGTYNGLALEEAMLNAIFLTERFSPLDWDDPSELSQPGSSRQVITRPINPHINNHLDDEWSAGGRVCMSGASDGDHEIDQFNSYYLGSPPDILMNAAGEAVPPTEAGEYKGLANAWCRAQYPAQNGTAFARACYELGKTCEAPDGSWRWCDDPLNEYTQSCFIKLGLPSNDLHQHYPFVLLVSWMTDATGSASETTRFAHMGDGNLRRTLGHEIGHLLGLGHGGVDANGKKDERKRKPNYWSTMSYGVAVPVMGIGAMGETIFFNAQQRSVFTWGNQRPAGLYLFSNNSTSYVLDETNLDETKGLNGGQPYMMRGVIFADKSSGSRINVIRDLDFTVADWDEDGAADDLNVKKDIDSSLASKDAHLRCHWWPIESVWARPKADDPTKPGSGCSPSTAIDSPRSDLSFLQGKDFSVDADKYTWQRDQLESRVSSDVRASWTNAAVPDEDVNIRRLLLSDDADPNLVVCEPWE